ncbi:hypothetical protein BbiDN127_0237 [Borreliella bissettiae DN127]|uniref:Uncharacterized protein n=1 Tax=Borrelia bissettiae (strain DSM 17990 / CIP 109136 / DN127) TaxID=521010 RepID=G0AL46_BORBD|nr:hypothetical protein BbiDN127_0237 [Borreliella bissettiae DN127]
MDEALDKVDIKSFFDSNWPMTLTLFAITESNKSKFLEIKALANFPN